ncbi:hypothetical protein IJ090_01800 [Candidatus Saccharibacteria bacterium]|nr:hypothetical protein [Candidatus Saccharibacteria bacterium]
MLKRLIKILILIIILFFFIWPFVNSAISHNFYLKVNTDGSPSTTWISELKDKTLSVEVYGRGNIATNKESSDHETYTNTLEQSDIDQIAEVIDKIRGWHIFVRLFPGYSFKYTGDDYQTVFMTKTDRENLLALGQALEYYARGDEVIKGSGYKSALEYGRAKLKSLRIALGLEKA